jgi:phosphatidylserine/phosphatidylglycerophosphate/cardiolipin synthase-like enzyme
LKGCAAKPLRLRLLFCPPLIALCFCAAPPLLHAGATFPARTTVLCNQDYADALLRGIRDARKSIVCSFYLFKIGEGGMNIPRSIAEELIRARKRGVTVRVILERSDRDNETLNVDNRRTAAFLERGGVKVQFDSPLVTTHNKVVVIDGRHVFLGSHNLTQAALRYNNELSVRIESPEMASEILSLLDGE